MIPELTDGEVVILYRHSEGKRKIEWEKELRARTRWTLIKAMPSKTGICAAGRPIVIDDKGVYSSGYVIHNERGHTVCDHEPWAWNDRTPHEKFTRALIETLR